MPFVPNTATPGHVRNFPQPAPTQANRTITGITRDALGNPLGSCTVFLFDWSAVSLGQITFAGSVTSDASGNYSFAVDPTKTWRVVTDDQTNTLAGVSLNNLVGV